MEELPSDIREYIYDIIYRLYLRKVCNIYFGRELIYNGNENIATHLKTEDKHIIFDYFSLGIRTSYFLYSEKNWEKYFSGYVEDSSSEEDKSSVFGDFLNSSEEDS